MKESSPINSLTNEEDSLSTKISTSDVEIHQKEQIISYSHRIIFQFPWKEKPALLGNKESFPLFILILVAMIGIVNGLIICTIHFFSFSWVLISSILLIISIYYFILCFITEPGIIPKNHPDFQRKEEKVQKEEKGYSHAEELKNETKLDINEDVLIDEQPEEKKENKTEEKEEKETKAIAPIFTERYCKTCKIMRPPSCSHCKFCDCCIRNFDQ